MNLCYLYEQFEMQTNDTVTNSIIHRVAATPTTTTCVSRSTAQSCVRIQSVTLAVGVRFQIAI